MTARVEARLREVRESVRQRAENRPGVYRMLGPGGGLLYVGKSVRVRSRLLSYFRAPRGEKAAEIAAQTHRVDWDYVSSEFAALLHELRLIRRHRPPYNVQHKRRPGLALVQITREPAPRLRSVAPATADGRVAFGPLEGRIRTAAAVRHLTDLLGLRDCPTRVPVRFADQIELFGHRALPDCWRGETGRCLAPCAGGCTEAEYEDRLQEAARFLAGESDAPVRLLRERIEQASDALNYEYAATLLERVHLLERLQRDAVRVRDELADLWFVYPVDGWQGDDRWYLIRHGVVAAELRAPRGRVAKQDAARQIEEVFDGQTPDIGRVPLDRIVEMLLVARWFRLRPEQRGRAFAPGVPRAVFSSSTTTQLSG
ncbi:MAG: nuclease [Longimicrobiales bacterium]